MYFTLSTTRTPATDLGHVLGKHPEHGVQSFDLPLGRGHVWFPEASETRATAAVAIDVALDRGRDQPAWPQHLRPLASWCACSAVHALALPKLFKSALRGRVPEGVSLDAWPLELRFGNLLVDTDLVPDVAAAYLAALGLAETSLGERRVEGRWTLVDVTARGVANPVGLLRRIAALLPALSSATPALVGPDAIGGFRQRARNGAFDAALASWIDARYSAMLAAPPSAADLGSGVPGEVLARDTEDALVDALDGLSASSVELRPHSGLDVDRLVDRLGREPRYRRIVVTLAEPSAAARPDDPAEDRIQHRWVPLDLRGMPVEPPVDVLVMLGESVFEPSEAERVILVRGGTVTEVSA